jgi:hypothetical protein
VVAVAAVVLLWYLFDVLLLIFAAVLIAILIHAPTQWIARHWRFAHSWSLVIVLLAIVLLTGATGWLVGSAVRQQFAAIAEQAPQMLEQVQDQLRSLGWLHDRFDPQKLLDASQGAFLGRGLRVVSATFGAIANFGLILPGEQSHDCLVGGSPVPGYSNRGRNARAIRAAARGLLAAGAATGVAGVTWGVDGSHGRNSRHAAGCGTAGLRADVLRGGRARRLYAMRKGYFLQRQWCKQPPDPARCPFTPLAWIVLEHVLVDADPLA